jgi:hypothetical protein
MTRNEWKSLPLSGWYHALKPPTRDLNCGFEKSENEQDCSNTALVVVFAALISEPFAKINKMETGKK